MVKQTLYKQDVKAHKSDGGSVMSELDKFKLSFEYNETYSEIRKALKKRTIQVLKRVKKQPPK